MKSRYLLSAGAALAVAFGCAEANAQFAFMGGPYPTVFYVGPEGGWTSLSNQKDTITTVPFRVDSGVVIPPNGPFFNKFNGSARYDSGFNAGGRLGMQYGPWRLEEEYSYRRNGLSSFGAFFGPNINSAFTGERVTHSIMTNVIYDFVVGWPVTPHIGFGIGAVDNVELHLTQPGHPQRPGKDDGQYSGGRCRCNRGDNAIPKPDYWRDLPEGKPMEFRLSGDRRFPLRHQPVARV